MLLTLLLLAVVFKLNLYVDVVVVLWLDAVGSKSQSIFRFVCVCHVARLFLVGLFLCGFIVICVRHVFWDCVSLSFAMGRKKMKYRKEGCFFEQFVFPTRTIDGHDTGDLDLECFEDEDKVYVESFNPGGYL